MRCRQDHRLDRWILQNRIIGGTDHHASGLDKSACAARFKGDPAHKAQERTPLDRFDQLLAPPAKADNGSVKHYSFSMLVDGGAQSIRLAETLTRRPAPSAISVASFRASASLNAAKSFTMTANAFE